MEGPNHPGQSEASRNPSVPTVTEMGDAAQTHLIPAFQGSLKEAVGYFLSLLLLKPVVHGV